MQKSVNRLILIVLLFSLILPAAKVQADEYLWAGANQYQLWFQHPERIQSQLDAMQHAGLSVLRIFLGQRPYQSWEDPPDAYTFEDPIGTYNDANLERVDALMDACNKRGIKLIIALNNHSDIYLKKWGATGMYSDPEALQAYKNRFTYFLNHTNAILGKPWKDCNDVVYAWEIQNEPGIPLLDVSGLSSTQRHDMIRAFLNEMADHLKSIDPDTKVSLGIAGYANYYHGGKSGDDIRTLGNIESADIYTLHFYGGNLADWINDNLNYCRSINKLLFVEEFGDTRSTGMENLKSLYRSVTRTCRQKGVPWMFWRMGHRKDSNTWSVMDTDAVWKAVIAPEAALINQTVTPDAWVIHPLETSMSAAASKVERPVFRIHVYPNPTPGTAVLRFPVETPVRSVHIVDILGRDIFSHRFSGSPVMNAWQWTGRDNHGVPVANGIYIAQVRTQAGTVQAKISVVK